jgi:hypothetical protein
MNRSEFQSTYIWQQFLVEQSLDGYFDSMSVNKKCHLWIGLGSIKKKPAGAFNPTTQSTFFKTPPRLPKSSHALLQKSRLMMLAVLDLYHKDNEKKKKQADDDNDNLEVNKGTD